MATVESGLERTRNLPSFFAILKKESTLEKPRVNKFKEKDIFLSSKSTGFTDFGQKVFGLVISGQTISDPQMSPALRTETISALEKKCEELGLRFDQLQAVGDQLMPIVKKRMNEITLYGHSLTLRERVLKKIHDFC